MWYGEFGIWLWVITSLWLWVEAILYLRRPVSTLTGVNTESMEIVKDMNKTRRRLLLVATIGYTIAWLMFIPFILLYFYMPRH